LKYTAPDNTDKTPVMIHRAILGSLERFLGILIEHYAGNFPVWLAPEQVRVLPISEKTADYANEVLNLLKIENLRASVDLSDDKVGAKIARAHADKIPYMLVVGPKEAEAGLVNVRMRQSQDTKTVSLGELTSIIQNKIVDKSVDLSF
jgi:threonyl-tRNA synthetase